MPKGQQSKNNRRVMRRMKRGKGTDGFSPSFIEQDILSRFEEKEMVIVGMAKEHNFYPQEVFSFIYATKMSEHFGCFGHLKPEISLLGDPGSAIEGFLLQCWSQKTEGACMIEYFFLLPEYRRKGTFTKYINQVKGWDEVKTININTDKENMIRALNKLGFKCEGKCKNDVELYFKWTK